MSSLLEKSRNPKKDIFKSYQCCVDEVVCNKLTVVHGGDGPHPDPAQSAKCTLSTHYIGDVDATAWTAAHPINLGSNGVVTIEGKDIAADGSQTDVSTNTALTAAVSARECIVGIRLPRSSVITAGATAWNVSCSVQTHAAVAFGSSPYTTEVYLSKELTNASFLNEQFPRIVLTGSLSFPNTTQTFTFTIQNSEIPDGDVQAFYLFVAYTGGPTGNTTVEGASYSISAVPSTSST